VNNFVTKDQVLWLVDYLQTATPQKIFASAKTLITCHHQVIYCCCCSAL